MTEEALDESSFPRFVTALNRQPAWSDIAVILFAGGMQPSAAVRMLGVVEALRNVTVIERPIRVAAVVSVVRAALRARLRQVPDAGHAPGAQGGARPRPRRQAG